MVRISHALDAPAPVEKKLFTTTFLFGQRMMLKSVARRACVS
jgi:hypothetical protein